MKNKIFAKHTAQLCRVASAVVMVTALLCFGGSARAQSSAQIDDGCGTAFLWFGDCPSPEGSWLYTVTIPGAAGTAPFVFQGVETYAAGGGYSEADQLLFMKGYPATAGHGAWKMTGEHRFLLTYMNLTYDKHQATGSSLIRQTTRISADGKTYTGSGDFAYYDTNGNPVTGGSGTFTITATRILVQKPQ